MTVKQNSLKVLVIDEEIPYPPDSGKRIRTWNLLKRLALTHTVHLLCYGRPEDPRCRVLSSAGIVLRLVDPPDQREGFSLYSRLFANLFSRYPYSVVKHYSRRFQGSLDRLLASEHWDLLHCEWTPYARFLRTVSLPTVIATHNVESQIWQRRADLSKGIVERVFFRLQEWKMAWFERKALLAARVVTAVSEGDAKKMKSWGIDDVAIIPNGVDPDSYTPSNNEAPGEILSIASLDWFPNAESMSYFAQEILPLIQHRRPNVVFRIVGRRPPRSLQQSLQGLPGVDFVGEVDDVRPHLDRAAVVVVPLRVGGGSRLKILEALAAGKAVVSTSVGAEGLELQAGRHLLVADSPDDFATRVVSLLESPTERTRLANDGRQFVLERYGWDSIAADLGKIWREAVQRASEANDSRLRVLQLRASNFVGGPEKQILHHAVDARDFGVDVWIGSFRDQDGKPELIQKAEENGLPVFESLRAGRFDPRAVLDVASFLRREKIHLICTHGFKANVIGSLAKKLARVPQIAFCRGWTAETTSVRFYEWMERRFLALADRIICVSEAQAEYFNGSHFLQPRVDVIHNAMLDSVETSSVGDRETSRSLLGLDKKALLIGVVGRLSIEKGQRYLVEAAPALMQEFRDLRIVLLGEGRERLNLESLVKKLGLQQAVILAGFQKNVARWMQAFDVVANCSLTEGIPNAILEALAVGTPVVATAVGGVPQLIRDRKTGLLVAPGSSEGLARALAEVLRDPQMASDLGRAGQTWVRERFAAEGQRDALLKVYVETMSTKQYAQASQSRQPSQVLKPMGWFR
jgi:glycosyltransferase involved in cell wall biosynthesis